MKTHDQWLLDLPTIFTFAFTWENDENVEKEQLEKVYKLVRPLLDVRNILTFQNAHANSRYVLRGMITYYGHHYMAYFYSARYLAEC